PAVLQPARDEVAGVGIEVHILSVRRLADDVGNRAGVDPRMAAEERTSAAGPQDNSSRHKIGSSRTNDLAWCSGEEKEIAQGTWVHLSPRSTASMYAKARSSSRLLIRLFRTERTRNKSSVLLIGLVRKSSVPASTARSMSLRGS